jgi:hypothetical protein
MNDSPQRRPDLGGTAFLECGWKEIIIEGDEYGVERINRINCEIPVLQALRDRLRCEHGMETRLPLEDPAGLMA